MPEALELPSLTAAAARAASEGDVPTAAALLRQALDLQVSTLGPDHPDLAITLNNLALMLEQLGHMKEAGQCYHRAHAIAAAALGPDNPAVQVSRANLDAFRAMYGETEGGDASTPLDPSVWGELGDFPATGAGATPPETGTGPVTGAAAEPEPRLELLLDEHVEAAGGEQKPEPEVEFDIAPVPVRVPVQPTGPRPSPPRPRAARPTPHAAAEPRSRRPVVPSMVVVAVLLAVVTTWWWTRPEVPSPAATAAAPGGPDASTTTPDTARPAPPLETPAATAAATPPSVASPPAAPTSPPATGAGPVAVRKTAPASVDPPRPAAGGSLGVTDARLCAALSRSRNPWTCEPVGSPVGSGSVYYLTRVRSARDVAVIHRWVHDGNVVRTVRLQVRANPTDGFRTFTRQTVGGPGSGTWVVSLLAPDGTVLDEQRFDVR
jgi:hypothetical protein